MGEKENLTTRCGNFKIKTNHKSVQRNAKAKGQKNLGLGTLLGSVTSHTLKGRANVLTLSGGVVGGGKENMPKEEEEEKFLGRGTLGTGRRSGYL